MKKFLVLFFLSYCIYLDAHSLEHFQTLKTGQLLQLDFIQKKSISGIPKPLISEGTVLLWEGKGLIWEVKTPFPCSILITPTGIFDIENDQKTPLISSERVAQQGPIFTLLFKILAGDFSGLDLFQIINLPAEQSEWKYRLITQNQTLKNFLYAIDIEGSNYVSKLRLIRSEQDSDEIIFSDPILFDEQAIQQALKPIQKALFE
ncbi:MAG: hypothetical protein K0S74_392 [Chlamydiales bacterium]|jgi:hypothetical protein|nr:hypothetical protein [Chlamydiales bacterium]